MDYYEDWCNEQLSFMGNLDKYDPQLKSGTRRSFNCAGRDMYEQEMKIRLQLIESGAIKDQCISCKSINTTYNNGMWGCNICHEKWDPLVLRFKGI